tara:strand:- start:943 stop:1563 length:621 start_codon:yes stop_codon:yes gene_type:complete
MTFRVRRKFTSTTFFVDGQLCKVFLEPWGQFRKGFYVWNVGFVIGSSRRQVNDWYRKRKNKRRRSLEKRFIGKSGLKAIAKAFEVLRELRWVIEPGDCVLLDCTSGDPDRQFRAWQRWQRRYDDWVIDHERKEFYWHRPPYADDLAWKHFKIHGVIPPNPLESTAGQNYHDCFLVSLPQDKTQSRYRIPDLLDQAPSSDTGCGSRP